MALPGGGELRYSMLNHEKEAGWDDIPVPVEAVKAVAKNLIPPKSEDYKNKFVVRTIINKKLKSKENFLTLYSMNQIVDILTLEVVEVLPFGKQMLTYLDNRQVRWDVIEKVEKLPDRMDMYDLTVPGYDTFMLANQLIAYDTVQLHVPILPKAVEDAKKLTLDKLLFSEKTRSDLLVKPDMEAIIGLYEATKTKSSGKKFKFKNKEEAMRAYYKGDLKPNDEVVIG